MVAIIEELFFRSLILQIMLKCYQKTNISIVIILNSIMFTFMHMFNVLLQIDTIGYTGVFHNCLLISIFGCVLAIGYYFYENVIICISIHIGFNMISAIVIGQNHMMYILLYMILVTLILVTFRNKTEKRRLKK